MNDNEEIQDLICGEINDIKSEKEAQRLFMEIKPQHEKLSIKFFSNEENDNEIEENDIAWIDELNEYIAKVVQLYINYHVKGDLKHIHICLSVENPPNIILNINDQDYVIDYESFKNGTDESNRDDHRECYFRNESIWFEFQRFSDCFNINNVGQELCEKLGVAFPLVIIDYEVQ